MTVEHDAATKTTPHPADFRWQLACVLFMPAIEPPASQDTAGHDCKLMWVVREDWERFCEWRRKQGITR